MRGNWDYFLRINGNWTIVKISHLRPNMGMGMKSWELERTGKRKSFPHIPNIHLRSKHYMYAVCNMILVYN